MITVYINGKATQVLKNTKVLHACTKAGYPVPHLCYHEDLPAFGNCGICMVEIEGRAVRACSTPCEGGMEVKTRGIDLSKLEESRADNPLGEYSGAGTIFGATGGVMEAALRTAHYLATGQELADPKIGFVRGGKGIKKGKIELLGKDIRKAPARGLYKDDESCERRESHNNPSINKLYAEFLEAPNSKKAKELLHTSYISRPMKISKVQ